MRLRQRKIPKDEAQFLPQRLLQLFDHGIGGATVRALIIAIFNEGQGSVGGALGMIVGRNGRGERGRFVHDASWFGWCAYFGAVSFLRWAMAARAFKMPSAPGLMPTGET